MIIKNITKFSDLMECLDEHRNSTSWLYRGQSNVNWPLIPKLGRKPYSDITFGDKFIIEAWKRRASIFINRNITSWWDWLTLAQHHGVPTRLLDWSYTPLVAAYFACIDNVEFNGVIYAYHYREYINSENINPFEIEKTEVFRPTSISERVFNQGSIFTVHKTPFINLTEENCNGILQKWVVKKEFKKELQLKLNQLGINYSTIFPDLDGLAKHICWHLENTSYWAGGVNSIDKI